MKSLRTWAALMLVALCAFQALATEADDAKMDWPNLTAYRSANAMDGLPTQGERRVVFMGDSITEFWTKSYWNKSTINRGISGQTSPQMLLRFRADVIALKPKVVVILAGTNDIAGNTGTSTNEMIVDNIASMVDLARANGIKVVLCSVLPAAGFYWNEAARPAPQIAALNQLLQDYAKRQHLIYVDYYASMVDERPGLNKVYSDDGVHPNEAGYKVMITLVDKAIAAAIKGK
ncbi:MAG: SGNH/GDSL hydrolase family protein [Comamonadaceae bacterium]